MNREKFTIGIRELIFLRVKIDKRVCDLNVGSGTLLGAAA